MLKAFREYFDNYSSLNDEEWQAIRNEISIIKLKKGDHFISSGEISHKIGLIVKGCMRYYYIKNGDEITGEFWREREVVGSYESMFLEQPSTQNIEAIEPVTLLVLDYMHLRKLFARHHKIESICRRILEELLAESQARIASYIMDSPEERYLKLNDQMPGILNRVPQKYIASFIGVTPVSLSRIRKRIAEKKLG